MNDQARGWWRRSHKVCSWSYFSRIYEMIVFIFLYLEAEPPTQVKIAQEITIFVRYDWCVTW